MPEPLAPPRTPWRWPKQDRGSYPAQWLMAFGWRQFVAWTPKVGHWSAVVRLLLWPHGGALIGTTWFRDEDEEVVVRVGVGVAEIEVQGVSWTR